MADFRIVVAACVIPELHAPASSSPRSACMIGPGLHTAQKMNPNID